MRLPEDLYTLHTQDVDFGGPVMLHNLTGFLDAGAAGRLAAEHLLAALDHRTLATFELDDLMDYRARRPRTLFVADRYTSVEMPELALHEITDLAGTKALLLHGPEPDHGWAAVTAAVLQLVQRFGVRMAVGMHAIPWPAPHTRPVGMTAHATDATLIPGYHPWVGELEVPGHLSALVELRLGEAGHPAIGFAAHVPHYLVATEYPRAALALLEHVARTAGLALPLEALAAAADHVDGEVAQQVSAATENTEAVQALEAQYDAVMSSRSGSPPMSAEPIPSADEIAAQVESFLAELAAPPEDETGG